MAAKRGLHIDMPLRGRGPQARVSRPMHKMNSKRMGKKHKNMVGPILR